MYHGSKEGGQCPGLHQEKNYQHIKACACSTQCLVGQQKVIRGLEIAEAGELTGLPVHGRYGGKYSICKDVYSVTEEAVGTSSFRRILSR